MPDDLARRRHDRAMSAMADREDGTNTHLAKAAIARCQLCDNEGYRGGHICDHVNRTNVGRAQKDHIRKMLAKGGKS